MPELEIDVEACWSAGEWDALALRATQVAAQVAPELGNPRLTASLIFTSDEAIRQLNRDWRGKDKPTNVLSFPMLERTALLALPDKGPPELLGDIALAQETCAREAAEKGIPIEDHASHLIIHGLLHLAGYDHEISAEEADAMERLEIKALAQLGVADPYGADGA